MANFNFKDIITLQKTEHQSTFKLHFSSFFFLVHTVFKSSNTELHLNTHVCSTHGNAQMLMICVTRSKETQQNIRHDKLKMVPGRFETRSVMRTCVGSTKLSVVCRSEHESNQITHSLPLATHNYTALWVALTDNIHTCVFIIHIMCVMYNHSISKLGR